MPSRPLFLRIFALSALVILLTACGSGSSSPGGGNESGDRLNGTSWVLASIDGAAAVPGVAATAIFANGQVSGSGGCNSYGGKYEVRGNKLTTSEIVSTMMACADQSTMDQEAAFLGALGKAETFKITSDKLEITTSDGKTMAFTPQ